MTKALNAVQRLSDELRPHGVFWYRLSEYGVLTIEVEDAASDNNRHVDGTLFDDKEILVLTSRGRVTSFTIPVFAVHWTGHLDVLVEHLRAYLCGEKKAA